MSYLHRWSRTRWRRLRRAAVATIFGLALIFLYSEYLIYYVVQSQCEWPTLEGGDASQPEPVHAMLLADVHLLRERDGSWFDRMRHEWQMHRAFQTAIALHKPEIVFVLGDLFDEGLRCSEREFEEHVARFRRLFRVPDGTRLYTAVGNHDIGFHYRMTPYLVGRFERELNSPPVQLVSVRGNHFVLLNSMALEGDGCTVCDRAGALIDEISNLLRCSSGSSACKGEEKLSQYSRPILLQHFPLYLERELCVEGDAVEDSARPAERRDCLARESTERLAEALRPRAAFGGHTHRACRRRHKLGVEPYALHFDEHILASFSWRYLPAPHYTLAVFSTTEYGAATCAMREERTAALSAAALLLLLALYVRRVVRSKL